MPCAWWRELQDQKTPSPKMFVEKDDFLTYATCKSDS